MIYLQQEEYDAIVVGSGVSGGWAAKELTEKGLRTLVLERGREAEHQTAYVTEHVPPWEMPHRNRRVTPERSPASLPGTGALHLGAGGRGGGPVAALGTAVLSLERS